MSEKPLLAKRVQHDFVWKLRLTHLDRAEVRLEWRGPQIVFDPVTLLPGDVVVLTSAQPDRIRGTAAAVSAGQKPLVVADEAILRWLRQQGPLSDSPLPEGVVLTPTPYTPMVETLPVEHFLKASLIALRPRATLQNLKERASLPTVAPCVWALTLPEVGTLVHLDLALTADTPPAWVAAHRDWAQADWTLAGCAFGQGAAVAKHLTALGGKQILVTELINGERRARGLPTEGVTLLRDQLHAAGLPAHVFATQASYRFE